MCTPFLGEEDVSINGGITILWASRARFALKEALLALLFICQPAWPHAPEQNPRPQTPAAPLTQEASQTTPSRQKDLTRTSITDLMNLELTTASKKEQKLSQVAAPKHSRSSAHGSWIGCSSDQCQFLGHICSFQ